MLPTKCRNILVDLLGRGSGGRARKITEEHTLHIFVHEEFKPSKAGDKPEQGLFGNKELSTFVEGGEFGTFTKARLQRRLEYQRDLTQKTYIGIVSLRFDAIEANNKELNVLVLHDPFPYWSKGKKFNQAYNHAIILCDKDSTNKRKKFRELCDWSLSPDDLQKPLSRTDRARDALAEELIKLQLALSRKREPQ